MNRSSSRGFTLLELMIVMIIIGILAAYFLFSGGSIFGNAQVKQAKSRLQVLAGNIEAYRSVEGQFPNDRLGAQVATNVTNSSAEALFLALFDPEFRGEQPDQNWLVNTDGDESRKQLSMLPTRELFEVGDPWGNPIVYFDSLHYGDEVSVLAGPEEEVFEQAVHALRHERTGDWAQAGKFQLICAGPDGEFGTEDDVSNAGG